jgi:hypothetical protein
MPFKEGESRPENAGRKKGSRNKDTQWAIDLANEQDMHPFEVLLKFANRKHEALGLDEFITKVVGKGDNQTTVSEYTISPELQQKSAKDACEFILSKLKAVEHTGQSGADLFAKLLSEIHGSK